MNARGATTGKTNCSPLDPHSNRRREGSWKMFPGEKTSEIPINLRTWQGDGHKTMFSEELRGLQRRGCANMPALPGITYLYLKIPCDRVLALFFFPDSKKKKSCNQN